MMGSVPIFSFLRPYAVQPLPVRTAVYSSFFRASLQARSFSACSVNQTGLKEPHDYGTTSEGKGQDGLAHFDVFGATVAQRIQTLQDTGRLRYPRPRTLPNHCQIKHFLEKHSVTDDLPEGSVSALYTPAAVVLRGRVLHIRKASSKLAFVDIMDDFSTCQIVLDFKTVFAHASGKDAEDPEAMLRHFKNNVKMLHKGDIISVTGHPDSSPTRRVRLRATAIPEPLSPAIVPLPFTVAPDPSRRHIDLLVNPPYSQTLILRSMLVNSMRNFLVNQEFLEVSTPILTAEASGAAATPFRTARHDKNKHNGHGSQGSSDFDSHLASNHLALRIAPELWLKRLVVGGFGRVFEIGPAFRNEGVDHLHNPEFTICEFYKAHADLEDLITQTERIFSEIATKLAQVSSIPSVEGEMEGETKKHMVPPRLSLMPKQETIRAFIGNSGGSVDGTTHTPWPRVEFLPTLESKFGIRFASLNLDLHGGKTRLENALRNINALPEDILASCNDLPQLFDCLAGRYLEGGQPQPQPQHQDEGAGAGEGDQDSTTTTSTTSSSPPATNLPGPEVPFFITHHPSCMSPLSKSFLCPKTGVLVAARAELFYAGMELANMYEEENDPFEQRRKFLLQAQAQDQQPSSLLDPNPAPTSASIETETGMEAEGAAEPEPQQPQIDEQYIETLMSGMPPTGGWGCGIDRLVMVFSGQENIARVLAFGNLRNVVGVEARSRCLGEPGARNKHGSSEHEDGEECNKTEKKKGRNNGKGDRE